MPFRQQESILHLNLDKMTSIDTRSVEDLFGLWTVFSKTANALPQGKRLENMSWRLWNREAFCCRLETAAPTCKAGHHLAALNKPSQERNEPDLASSIDTLSSNEDNARQAPANEVAPSRVARPELRRLDSSDSRTRGSEKHISPVNLKDIVTSITETEEQSIQDLVLPTLSTSLPSPPPKTQRDPSPVPQVALEGVAYRQDLPIETRRPMPPPLLTKSSDTSSDSPRSSTSSKGSSAAISTSNVVRGFHPGGAPSSYRSQTQLATPPTTILKNSARNIQPNRKKPMFSIGAASSGEEESSLESRMYQTSLSSVSGSTRLGNKKHASFQDTDEAIKESQDSPVFESDDEDDDVDDDLGSEGAIEDDDEDSSDWEDDMGEDDKSDTDEAPVFKRVDSRPNLTSRRSLLTTLMSEPDRARALQNAASRSTPALRRTHTTPPESSSRAQSPGRERNGPDAHGLSSKAIAMAAQSQAHLGLSPRTTRRHMLSDELTESLRRNLLWERQFKSSQNLAALKRRHTAHDIKNLKQHPELPHMSSSGNNTQYTNEYFHAGLGAYHVKGW